MAISELKLPQGVTGREFGTPALLAEGQAKDVAQQLRTAIAARGVATLVVSGGRSPVAFFQSLAKQDLDWSKVVISLADERWVPVEHADSNAGLLKRYLLQGPVAKARFIGLYNAAANLDEAAQQADQFLAELPDIDVLVLGMGDDGHTASLFPNSPNLQAALQVDGSRRVWPMLAPTVPHQRLTMSRALLSSATFTVLAISGQSKLTTLNAALAGDELALMPIRAFLKPTLEIYWCP
ncbi:6-phosphogluconolactonase [Pseudomonas gingeri]|uniref:6-phosphogluconolactonase n=1 Tax=Pseudomonas gingeri TaxID=117681 RepID=UPI0015A1809A|nr:6-phosphogluconolactonase [Pseudomonas gingeri]NWD06088.1 6-phosphogluconolactonase [Pseudomonas gingeri]NWE32700.1 6-phosphogluconolactonase [Pseudomonas gingeri]NWE55130.1 6-phosphogluconolactonase [Pseudomonas gingeri]NWF03254.1 6-phosphogluconolactonase [Pseudomonas gingeri]